VRLQDRGQRAPARQAQGRRAPAQPRGAQLSTLGVVLIALGALVVGLALGGFIAQRRRLTAGEADFQAQIEQANQDLAAAHAADNGWDRERLEAAARRVFADTHPGHEISDLALVNVIDRPGTDADEAVFLVRGGGHEHRIVLGRTADDWVQI
jgi:hypothetical protein